MESGFVGEGEMEIELLMEEPMDVRRDQVDKGEPERRWNSA